MREILFRGKGTHGHKAGEWVYGAYVKDFWHPRTGHGILPPNGGYNEVDPETVGQFTGLTDKNGKKIFEGDILNISGIGNKEIVFYNGGFCFKVNGEHIAFMETPAYNFEYCGNIHDTPEVPSGTGKLTFENKEELAAFIKKQCGVVLKNIDGFCGNNPNLLYVEIPQNYKHSVLSLCNKYGIKTCEHLNNKYWLYVKGGGIDD